MIESAASAMSGWTAIFKSARFLPKTRPTTSLKFPLGLLGSPGVDAYALIIQMPSSSEGRCGAREAMRDGLPVVAFAVDALVESMREGGWLIEAEDYGAFVAKVQEILESTRKEREGMRREARDDVLREYPWEKTAREYVAVFEEERY